MTKLLVICGPTATGKTALALHLAKIFNGELISADSRQVYKDLNIGTGKEIDLVGNIYGYDIADPKEDFSISHYKKYIEKILPKIYKTNKLPILVGGTGLYIKAAIDDLETIHIPQDLKLRQELENKTPEELYAVLLNLNPAKANLMNESDKKNPRRLMRAIEISNSEYKIPHSKTKIYDLLLIGLTAEKSLLFDRIESRVIRRVSEGQEQEIKKLLNDGITWKNQSMNTLGYKEWQDYFASKASKEEVIARWTKNEEQYAKRQLTWFKKDNRITWFDISDPNYSEEVVKLVKSWYHQGEDHESKN